MVDVLPELTRRAVAFVDRSAAAKRPFFLYFAMTSPHQPVVPTPEFAGKSGAGDYGDFVAQTDWSVGQVLDALARAGVAENTLVLFTSDNGPEVGTPVPKGFPPRVGEIGAYARIEKHGHYSMGPLRGAKRDTWEGGHRVPFLARWPARIDAGTTSDETICHIDLMATFASLLGAGLPPDAGVDSYDISPALLGAPYARPIREATVHHSRSGRFAIRRGDWVLILAPSGDDNALLGVGPGVQRKPGDPDLGLGETAWLKRERGYVPHDQPGELFDLRRDQAQRHNLYAQHPEVVAELRALLERYVERGRSTPGPPQRNDVRIDLRADAL
jgi:arylsulfatase A-like enzyme